MVKITGSWDANQDGRTFVLTHNRDWENENYDYIPTELLKPFIKTYRIIETEDELINRVCPILHLQLPFVLKDKLAT
jgi:hypothetical protein